MRRLLKLTASIVLLFLGLALILVLGVGLSVIRAVAAAAKQLAEAVYRRLYAYLIRPMFVTAKRLRAQD
jgi:hypothetical protein